jgi:uncharacterized protein (DUF1501 family)
MPSSRRAFLKDSAVAMFGIGAAPAWLSRTVYAATGAGNRRRKVLIAIFQRGAVDGLNMVVPFGDKSYSALRPSLAVAAPDGTAQSAQDLDGFFGLHPALSPLVPIFRDGHLAVIEAVGSPDPTRSHFDAQDYMESGTPGRKGTTDGWLNRAIPPEPGRHSPVRAVAVAPNLPRTLRGRNEAVAVRNLNDFQVRDASLAGAFQSMYDASSDTVLHGTAVETFEAVRLIQSVQKQPYSPGGGAEYPPSQFGQALQQIARLIRADVGLEVAFADIGGWDTHVNQDRPLANRLAEFAQALAAFYRDMGDRMADVVVVTMSEFGRTARENGNRGTDHGHANVMFAIGGDVRGGRVYGEWPGLAPEQLNEGRDLALTTDFRDVLGEAVCRHLGNWNVGAVFPGYTPKFREILS